MNPYTQFIGHDTNVDLSWQMLVSEAAYKVVTLIERVFASSWRLRSANPTVKCENGRAGKTGVSPILVAFNWGWKKP